MLKNILFKQGDLIELVVERGGLLSVEEDKIRLSVNATLFDRLPDYNPD